MKHTVIIDDQTYECANGFISRCVAAVHMENHADARRVCEILNKAAAEEKRCSCGKSATETCYNPDCARPSCTVY